MGYPVEYIEFGGEKRPVKYGFNALAIISKSGDLDMSVIDSDGSGVDFSLVRVIVYAGLLEGARAEKKEFTLTLEDVGDILDDDLDKSEEFVKLLAEQIPQTKKK